MKKPVKILAWVAGVAALLVISAVVVLKLYVTQERVKGWVIPPMEAECQ